MSVLQIKNASVTAENENGKNEILKDISLTFEKGKIYVITGPNGGGKSTLAKYIMGIMPGSGTILLDDEDITDCSIVERSKKGIGFAFQTPARFKGLKVNELMKLAAGGDDHVKIRRTLRNVGLCPEDYLDRDIDNTFSGGELKRIEIATILARDLKVAVFDEPEAGIDLWSFQRLTETFSELNRSTDTCIIIISHQERILSLADEIVVIEKGAVKEITTQKKFLDQIYKTTSCADCHRECCSGGNYNANIIR